MAINSNEDEKKFVHEGKMELTEDASKNIKRTFDNFSTIYGESNVQEILGTFKKVSNAKKVAEDQTAEAQSKVKSSQTISERLRGGQYNFIDNLSETAERNNWGKQITNNAVSRIAGLRPDVANKYASIFDLKNSNEASIFASSLKGISGIKNLDDKQLSKFKDILGSDKTDSEKTESLINSGKEEFDNQLKKSTKMISALGEAAYGASKVMNTMIDYQKGLVLNPYQSATDMASRQIGQSANMGSSIGGAIGGAIGGIAGVAGAALAPETMGLSLLIPVLFSGIGKSFGSSIGGLLGAENGVEKYGTELAKKLGYSNPSRLAEAVGQNTSDYAYGGMLGDYFSKSKAHQIFSSVEMSKTSIGVKYNMPAASTGDVIKSVINPISAYSRMGGDNSLYSNLLNQAKSSGYQMSTLAQMSGQLVNAPDVQSGKLSLSSATKRYSELYKMNQNAGGFYAQYENMGFVGKTVTNAMSSSILGVSAEDLEKNLNSSNAGEYRNKMLSKLSSEHMSMDLLKDVSPDLYKMLSSTKTSDSSIPEILGSIDKTLKDSNILLKAVQEIGNKIGEAIKGIYDACIGFFNWVVNKSNQSINSMPQPIKDYISKGDMFSPALFPIYIYNTAKKAATSAMDKMIGR